jgi:hypothetical protein
MNRNLKRWLSAAAVLAVAGSSLAPAAYAQDLDGGGLPQELHQGDLTFVTGGVGLDESQALREAAPHWPLAMRFTGSGSDYLADVHVRIADAGGAVVLQADSRGPYMLVKLHPGRYNVTASYEGHDQTRALTLKRGSHEKLDFSWPQP